jgi:hypothetical protein
MVEEPQLREWIAAERRELAAVLTALPPADRFTPWWEHRASGQGR